MPFEYLWGVLETQAKVPNSKIFHSAEGAYKFYPFAHEGSIFTFDEMIWNSLQEKCACADLIPSVRKIENILSNDQNKKAGFLFAFSDPDLDPTIKEGNPIRIKKIPSKLRNSFLKNFDKLGYDVVDLYGLSALTNIGYMPNDLQLFQAADVGVNKYGLINDSSEAIKIADLASRLAPENAPFFPVCLWGNKSIQAITK